MTCRDYERGWNELIDKDRAGLVRVDSVSADTENALVDHAAGCASCRALGARYLVLRRAIQSGVQSQAPSAGLADRVLAEIERPSPSAWAVFGDVLPERIAPVAAVYAVIVTIAATIALFLGSLNRAMLQAQLDRPRIVLHPTPVPKGHDDYTETVPANARQLNTAVAEATAATWDLARSASEPAARISRQVLNAATEAELTSSLPDTDARTEPVAARSSIPSLAALAPDTAAAGAMLLQVGDRLAIGVRPLSDTARHAFGFLLGPTIAKPKAPANLPAPKGA
jgi:hypothetical protein